ncbi:hypothetical protein Tco_1279488, partial [Tanacetum coccineum]
MVCYHKCCGGGKIVLQRETEPPGYTKQRYEDPEKEKVRNKLALSDLLQHNPKSCRDIKADNLALMYDLSETYNAVSLKNACDLFVLEQFDKLHSEL